MNKSYKYRKVFYGKDKKILLVTKNTTNFKNINIDRVINPISTLGDELIFNYDEKYISILEYIQQKGKLDAKEVIMLTISIGYLLKDINNKGYIVGSLDLEDICFNKRNTKELFLRQSRALFSLKESESIKLYNPGTLTISQINYGNFSNINYSSDVELLGKIFIKLATDRDVKSYEELRYISYNLNLFRQDMYIELQRFVNKITSIYPHEKYTNIEEAINDLLDLLKYIESKNKLENSINNIITYSAICHVGNGKLKKETSCGNTENINQDHCRIHEIEGKVFAFVADGVSNCQYGNGYIASRTVKQVCEELLQMKFEHIKTKEDVYEFYSEIINKSNKRIIDYVEEKYSTIENDNIMCTTFVAATIIDDNLYIASIGDSRAYLINSFIDTIITTDDTYGNYKLKENITWQEYKNLNNKSSLTNVIGNINGKTSFKFQHLKVTKGDVIVICSDGLVDYIPDLIDMKNDWKKQNKLTEIILEGINKNYNISRINYDLVERANDNGGLDNISSILIQV